MNGAGRVVAAPGWRGTSLTTLWARSPLRLLAPRNHGGAAWVFAATLGGGLVDGDAIALEAGVAPGAALLLGTQASTKVYRAPRAGASHRLAARVEEDALLVLLPDPVVCFAGARYAQETDIDLAGGSLVAVDAYTAGRAARGERWAFARFAARTVVRSAGQEVLRDAVLLDPAHGDLAARMQGFDVVATAIAVGPRAAGVAASLLAAPPAPERGAALVAAASPIAGGVWLRAAATSTAHALDFLRRALGPLPALLGDDPFARKW